MPESASVDLLTLEDVDAASAEVETAVDATAEIDPWCSGPDWTLPVHLGFAPRAERLLVRQDAPTGPGFALLARYRTDDGRAAIAGLDPLWGFATPVVGPDIDTTGSALCELLSRDRHWELLWLTGMPVPTGPDSFLPRLIRVLGPLGRVAVAPGISSRLADLSGGHDAWLARRSSRFRRNLRRAGHRAAAAGLVIVDVSADDRPFERLLAIEHQSWKGRDGGGITSPEMEATYRSMVRRLAAEGRLRLLVARLDGQDVGYVLGGVRGRTYRGLQISYHPAVAPLSVGHLLQHHQIRLLTGADEVDHYDLGMDMAYKERWSDSARTSHTLVIERGRDVLA